MFDSPIDNSYILVAHSQPPQDGCLRVLIHVVYATRSHVPIAYHGRCSTIIVSGQPVIRPVGQMRPDTNDSEGTTPSFGTTRQLDYEVEMGYVIGGPSNALGEPISISGARDRIFGAVVLNDWSGE